MQGVLIVTNLSTVVHEADNGGRGACIVQWYVSAFLWPLVFAVNLKLSKDKICYK